MIADAIDRNSKTCILHKYIRLIVDDLETSGTTGFGAQKTENVELNRLLKLASYYCD